MIGCLIRTVMRLAGVALIVGAFCLGYYMRGAS